MKRYTLPFSTLTLRDQRLVGGKNASLGELIKALTPKGILVPDGFAITVDGFKDFLWHNKLDASLDRTIKKLDLRTLDNLSEIAKECRVQILDSELPGDLRRSIIYGFSNLIAEHGPKITLAVRSSGIAEDSPTASFAGQHDSFLNIKNEEELLSAVRKCYASLYNERAIKYRIDNGFGHDKTGISVGIQIMVRSDKGSAGVAFTIEPESGNKNLIYITGAWGLGESVVQGAVNTDEFYLCKPLIGSADKNIVFRTMGSKDQMIVYGDEDSKNTLWVKTPVVLRNQFVLTDDELQTLGRWCKIIEDHYGMPMDIEWAKDGITSRLFIVQARPETIHSQKRGIEIREYKLKTSEKPLLTGKAVGKSIVSGQVRIINSLADAGKVKSGDIIVADITNPDWNALLKKAISIVTNKGGRTSHASIIARELGIPAVVGTLHATEKLVDGQVITVSCASGDEGLVYNGKLHWVEKKSMLKDLGKTQTKPMLILADPKKAPHYATYPNQGVGLLRMEFIVSNRIQIHPMALVHFTDLPDVPQKNQIASLTTHYSDKKEFFTNTLAESIGMVATSFYPKEVIVRMSDFKTNEYAKLLGGKFFEPEEENPMLGFRGASRYYNERYKEGFGLECQAIRRVRNDMGLTNVKVMIPFCRTIDEAEKVLDTMSDFGLKRGENGLEIYVMAEIPSNILLAEQFATLFDGFSIGSNDLTQLTLGLDRDSAIVSDLFDESNEAVTQLIVRLIEVGHHQGVKVGFCGQAPSDHPDFARFLVSNHIDSISFNPDSLISGIRNIIVAEKETTTSVI